MAHNGLSNDTGSASGGRLVIGILAAMTVLTLGSVLPAVKNCWPLFAGTIFVCGMWVGRNLTALRPIYELWRQRDRARRAQRRNRAAAANRPAADPPAAAEPAPGKSESPAERRERQRAA